MKLRSLIILLAIFNISLVRAQGNNLSAGYKRMLEHPAYSSAQVGISVREVAEGREVISIESNKNYTPASILKLLTTSAAVSALGPDYQFETKLATNGKIAKGIVENDLIIIGGGDPSLESERMEGQVHVIDRWVSLLRAQKVELIKGNLIVDVSRYGDLEVPLNWPYGDVCNYYGAIPSPLTAFDNTYQLHLESGEAGKLVTITNKSAEASNLDFISYVTASKVKKDLAYIVGDPKGTLRRVVGTIPEKREDFVIKGAIGEPAVTFATVFLEALKDAGIVLEGRIVKQKEKKEEKLKELDVHKSPPVKDLIKEVNFTSNNLFADQLMCEYAIKKGESVNDMKSVAQSLTSYCGDKGVAVYLEDGSGMSPANRLSPAGMTKMIREALIAETSEAFTRSIPKAGEEGSVKNLLKHEDVIGKVWAKSGSMNGVLNYAGYLVSKNGVKYSFTFMINNYIGSKGDMRIMVGNMLAKMVRTLP